MTLFHFSEDSTIRRFEPQALADQPDSQAFVWAIDEDHAPHYFFPRDCPRVCFWTGPETTPADRERFFAHTAATKVIAIESGWLERVQQAQVCAYVMPPETFVLQDRNAGYFVSTSAVSPLGVEPLGDLLGRLAKAGVELRVTPSLWPLRDDLVASTVSFSIIRLRNAAPRPREP